MSINVGNNDREAWWVTNNTSSTLIIGDLPDMPSIYSGKRVNLLSHTTKNEISQSKVLPALLKTGKLLLNKQKDFTDGNVPGNVEIRDADKSIISAEENETGAILYHALTDNAILKTNLTNDTLEETGITSDDCCCLNNVGSIRFDLTPTVDHSEGLLHWSEDDGTLELGLPGGNVRLQMGQEIMMRVKNTSGSTITNGELVRVTGASGSRAEVGLAHATDHHSANGTIAMATEDLLHNQSGYVTTFGLVRDVKTDFDANGTPLSDGNAIFLSETPGKFVKYPGEAPSSTVFLGVVLRSHGTEGVVFVRITTLPNVTELSDVNITTIQENDVLQWVITDPSANLGRWENTDTPTFDNLILTNLPTSDPSIAGAVWSESGTLKISAG